MKRKALAVALVVGVAVAAAAVALATRSHHIGRSLSIPTATGAALRREGIYLRLAPSGVRPPVDAKTALASLTADLLEMHARPQQLYLVLTKHNTHIWLAWMAVGHGVGQQPKCPPDDHGCPEWISGPAVALLNAKTGNGMIESGFSE